MPEGPPPAPVVQRVRLQYAKRGRLRFSSTRDFQRALERALRRAKVPMAFSAGFHPHPRISYANAATTGTASEAEYVELSLAERVDVELLREALDEALPTGLDVVRVVEAGPVPLAERLQASHWRIVLAGASVATLDAAVQGLLAQDRVEVTRMVKAGPRTFDVRHAVVRADTSRDDASGCAILHLVVRHTTPAVRPDDILTALRSVTGFVPPSPPLVTRLAQGLLSAGSAEVADPLAPDQEVGGT